MPELKDRQYLLEGVRLLWPNFAGIEKKFNTQGDRNFAVVISEQEAAELANIGYPSKKSKPREGETEDEYEPFFFVKVTVKFGYKPPRIVSMTETSRTNLDEDTCGVLDHADIDVVDVIITPYDWVVGEKSGVSPYLKSIVVHINEDYLEKKYGLNNVRNAVTEEISTNA